MANDADPARRCSDLVQQASSGETAAVDALLARYLPSLTAYVRRHTGANLARDESRSDLVQSVCREVLEDLRGARFEYRGEGQFRQWLYQAALRKIQGRARYHGAERRSPAREVPIEDGGESDLAHSNTPSRGLAAGEEQARFRAAMARLDEQARQIVQWVSFEGLPHKTVAERLGITESHSRVLLSRALARIARIATGETS